MTEQDPLRYSILASGSTGNVTYLETDEHRILIDAGLSGKRIENLMAKIDRSLTDVDAIFVTHEHTDHCHGVGVLADAMEWIFMLIKELGMQWPAKLAKFR